MAFDTWITAAVLIVLVVALVSNRVSPPAGIVGATAVLFVFGVIDESQAFSGFASSAPITIAGLYVLAEAINKTGALRPVLNVVLDQGESVRRSLARLVIPTAAGSSLIANTPIVAMLVPPVVSWSDQSGRSASRFLIPLSYASILGGAVTVIGTSTNLVISGFLEEAGQEPLGLFEQAGIGLPVALIGLVLIILLAPAVLPDRRRPQAIDAEEAREFTMSMVVEQSGPLDGRSVADAGLRHLSGVFLVDVERDHTPLTVRPSLLLRAGDRLTFAGQVDQIVDLQAMRGLTSDVPTELLVGDSERGFFEAVLGPASPMIGRTLADVEFRARYQAAVLAVHRSGHRLPGKLGAITLRPGDTLLLLTARDFRAHWRDKSDFLLVSRLDGPALGATKQAPLAIAAFAAVVLLPAFGVLTVLKSVVLGAMAVVGLGVLRPREARDAVDVNVVLMIGGAFGLGTGVAQSGLAAHIAEAIATVASSTGDVGLVLALVVATMVLTEFLTNAAAAALVFPIAVDLSEQSGLELRTLAIGLAVAASASFLTPVGYQTNTMVYGPGGYRFTDYLRLGIPLSLMTVASVTTLVLNT